MSKANELDDSSLIAKLTAAFSPYIKSSHEAADIKEAIISHAGCQPTLHDGISQHQSKTVRLSRIFGKELAGLQRKYLECMRSNAEAQGHCHKLLKEASTSTSTAETKIPYESRTDALVSYLKYLRLHRINDALQIRKHYAESLLRYGSSENIAEMKPPRPIETNSEIEDTTRILEKVATAAATVQDLAGRLQKAVLQAKVQNDKEKARLAEVKANPRLAEHTSPGARLYAIVDTRGELVQWLEEHLSQNTGEHEEPAKIQSTDSPSKTPPPLQSISKHYSSYLSSREKLLIAVNRAIQVLPASNPKGTAQTNYDTKETVKMIISAPSRSTLPRVSQNLFPLLWHQISASLLRTYASSQICAELTSTIEIINRLGQESHLLPEHLPLTTPDEKKDHITPLISVWCFAAVDADKVLTAVVLRHMRQILQAMVESEQALSDLRKFRGEDEMKGKSKRNSRPGHGWRGLDGNLETEREAIRKRFSRHPFDISGDALHVGAQTSHTVGISPSCSRWMRKIEKGWSA